VGCHRSGTNLLYNNLLSAGGFAVYRGYLPIYKMLIPRFGSVEKVKNRRKILETWLRSKGFRRSDLNRHELMEQVLNTCQTGGDFIRIVMEAIARNQGVARWAVYDPDNVLYIPRIKADLPQALFIHIIRDGRDIALSLKKMGGFRPLPCTGNGQFARAGNTALRFLATTSRYITRTLYAIRRAPWRRLLNSCITTWITSGSRAQSAGLNRIPRFWKRKNRVAQIQFSAGRTSSRPRI